MIPFMARVSVRRGSRAFRLWIPLAIAWLLLLPIVLVLLPIAIVACLIARVDPLGAIGTFWAILCGVQGSEIEVENSSGSISIYVF
jgi:hypothetical protein